MLDLASRVGRKITPDRQTLGAALVGGSGALPVVVDLPPAHRLQLIRCREFWADAYLMLG